MSKYFTRFSETINLKEEKNVFNIRVNPFNSDCVGKVYFTDIQLQEGSNLTGYTLNTETMLEKLRLDRGISPIRFYNGIVRNKETIVLFNLGTTSAGLDAFIYPIQGMAKSSIELSQGYGSHKLKIKTSLNKDDEIKIKHQPDSVSKMEALLKKRAFFNTLPQVIVNT